MYKQVFIPNEQHNNIVIPRRWYGKEVEVTIQEKPQQTMRKEAAKQPEDYSNIEQVLQSVDDNDVREIRKIFEPYQFSFKNFKFNREEANNYD